MTVLAGATSADVVTVGIPAGSQGSIPAGARVDPSMTFAVTYGFLVGNVPMSRVETFTIPIAAADVANAAAKAMAIDTKINAAVPGPANLSVTSAGGNVSFATKGGQIITNITITQTAGRAANNNPFQLKEKDVANPVGMITEKIAAALGFQGSAIGGGTVVVSLLGPGGSANDIVVNTTAGQSGSSLAQDVASAINANTSFVATADGSNVNVAGLTNSNLFGAQLNDDGFESFTMSLSAVPEPSPLVLGAVSGIVLLGCSYLRSWRRRGVA